MPEASPIYVVNLPATEVLALRERDNIDARGLAELSPGQLVARLDEDDLQGWWRVFADTPGEGAYDGYVLAAYLAPWTQAPGAASGDQGSHAQDAQPASLPDEDISDALPESPMGGQS